MEIKSTNSYEKLLEHFVSSRFKYRNSVTLILKFSSDFSNRIPFTFSINGGINSSHIFPFFSHVPQLSLQSQNIPHGKWYTKKCCSFQFFFSGFNQCEYFYPPAEAIISAFEHKFLFRSFCCSQNQYESYSNEGENHKI